MKKPVRILIVDDHQLVREGLISIVSTFQSSLELVGAAGNGVETLNLIQNMDPKPEVVLMDINMPHMNGMDCTREIKKFFPEVRVIALTMHNQSLHIKQMLKEGAHGYVLKDCDKEELKEAILEVAKGNTFFSRGVTNKVMMEFSQLKREMNNLDVSSVSPREKEVLNHILQDKSNKEIADELYISIRTVETHKQNLISKTGAKSIAGLVVFAIKNNLLEDFPG
ncbi:response regulator transcription factor [Salegentibacter sp. JZCK2]|uniref:response regulator transcription factor n=1 Tax=Salegentibacter tibetensis TaxID=2873600 RepID=UPI001CC9280F|nr:response regulator transcription factor [Salegentibacter tibetensis]MBZ9728662.1 response regulator transcription factor [Salegentibacter tibetensis]